jgi:outer membrane protein assembly factor BamE (lipoprotein component of BamABCDE complex)
MRATVPLRLARFAVGVALCCLLNLGCGGSGGDGGKDKGGKDGDTGPKATKANFEKVKDGMSGKEVDDIMGPPTASAELDPKMMKDMIKGVKMPEIPVEVPGIPMPKITVKSWDADDTLFQVVFQEGKVVGKDSATKKAKVTQENGDKIKVGMSRAEVEVILGKGKVQSGVRVEGFSQDATVWEGTDGTITVLFVDDKVKAVAGWKKK